jgi:energy-coupling factor transporter transmembrane protein EcfT
MNPWSGVDPRAKLVAAVVLCLALTVAPASRTLALLPFVAVLVATAGQTRHRLWGVVRGVAVLWGLTLLANAFLVGGHRLGPEALGWLRPTEEGIRAGLEQGGRLAGLAGLSAWLVATTRALDVAGSLEWTVRRSPSIRRRAHRGLLPIVLSLRMIPLFADEARRLLDVDRLRHGPRRGGAGVGRVARLAPLWVSSVVMRADALAVALTLRGYQPDGERSFAHGYRFRLRDWGLVSASILGALFLRP